MKYNLKFLILTSTFLISACEAPRKNASYKEIAMHPLTMFAVPFLLTIFFLEGAADGETSDSHYEEIKNKRYVNIDNISCKAKSFSQTPMLNLENKNAFYGFEQPYLSQYQHFPQIIEKLDEINQTKTMRMCRNIKGNDLFKNKCLSIFENEPQKATGYWALKGGFQVNNKFYFNLKQGNKSIIIERNEIKDIIEEMSKTNKEMSRLFEYIYKPNYRLSSSYKSQIDYYSFCY